MLRWLPGINQSLALEHGVVRARHMEPLLTIQTARQQLDAALQARRVEAEAEVAEILSQARQQAQQMLQDAQADIEAARQAARAEGLEQAALEWHQRQTGRSLQGGRQLLSLNEKMASIVTRAVERMVSNSNPEGLFSQALCNVRALTQESMPLTLRVSPCDAQAARDCLAAQAANDAPSVRLSVDPSLPPNSCIFETENGALDASLPTQLKGLRLAVERALSKTAALASEPPHDAAPSDPFDAFEEQDEAA